MSFDFSSGELSIDGHATLRDVAEVSYHNNGTPSYAYDDFVTATVAYDPDGTPGNDVIKSLDVNVFQLVDAPAPFWHQQLQLIVYEGHGGNDDFTNNTFIASYADGGGGNDTLTGGLNADTLIGGSGDDVLFGGFGSDNLRGNQGHDYLSGGAGNDDLRGDSGNDSLYGDAGLDKLQGGSGDDFLDGGHDNVGDELYGYTSYGDGDSAYDTFVREMRSVVGVCTNIDAAGDIEDWYDSYTGAADCGGGIGGGLGVIDEFVGPTRGEDANQGGGEFAFGKVTPVVAMVGEFAAPTIQATVQNGVLTISGIDDHDELVTIEIDEHNPILATDDELVVTQTYDPYEGPYNDVVLTQTFALSGEIAEAGGGGTGITEIHYSGLGGDDHIINHTSIRLVAHGGDGNDKLEGGSGDDELYGDDGNDFLKGWAGEDELWGGWGDDLLWGGEDADELHGQMGNDELVGSTAFAGLFDGGDGVEDLLDGGLDNDKGYVENGWRWVETEFDGTQLQCVNIDGLASGSSIEEWDDQDSCPGPVGPPTIDEKAVPPGPSTDGRDFQAFDPAFRGGVRVAAGDVTGDGAVDLVDFAVMKMHFGNSGDLADGDLDRDGEVGLKDFVILKKNFGV